MTWLALVYVVHEGFLELGIEDKALSRIRARIDLQAFRRFRNGIFHFQPYYHSPKIVALLRKGPLRAIHALHERHDTLVKRAIKYVVQHPLADDNSVLSYPETEAIARSL